MKRSLSIILMVVIVVLNLAVTAFAVAPSEIVLKYSLDVDGSHDITVSSGSIITVRYQIINQHSDEAALTETTQDQFKYDHNFFELVSDGVAVSDGDSIGDYDLTEVFETSTPIDSDPDQTHYIYYNSKVSLTVDPEEELTIGQFQLKVIATSGSSTILNTAYKAFDAQSKIFGSTCQDLKVTIGGTSIDKPTAKDMMYTGSEVVGVAEGTGYTVINGTKTDVGKYTATATLKDGYVWSDGSSDAAQISWEILTVTDWHIKNSKTDSETKYLMGRQHKVDDDEVGRTIIGLTAEHRASLGEDDKLVIVGGDGTKEFTIEVDCAYSYFWNVGESSTEKITAQQMNVAAFIIFDKDNNDDTISGYGYYRVYKNSADKDNFMFDVLYLPND